MAESETRGEGVGPVGVRWTINRTTITINIHKTIPRVSEPELGIME